MSSNLTADIFKDNMTKVKYKFNDKNNKGYDTVTKAPCRHCLEHATFRVITVEEENEATGQLQHINRVSCTRCLRSCRYNKKYKIIQHPIVKVTYFSRRDLLLRKWYRFKRYIIGDHIYGPFGRKRKK